MRKLVLIAALLLAGCASEYTYCKGKGVITGQAMIYGGTVVIDCSQAGPDGMILYQGKRPPTVPAPVPAVR